jgi:tRNA-specific 2-thiouridylase
VTTSQMGQAVAVGMSGGVDSSVAALLLKEAGYAVIGITMKIWQGPSGSSMTLRSGCYGPGEAHDIEDARKACEILRIPHYTVDLSQEFSENVLNNYTSQLLAGNTPNPCIWCNQHLKFGLLLDKAKSSGIQFDRFATGHYSRIAHGGAGQRYLLQKAVDKSKDQSYFLYRLNQDQLRMSLFPLGSFQKSEIKIKARTAGLADFAAKPESQDFFDAEIKESFLSSLENQPGNIVDISGRVLGTHDGLHHFTIGQRKRLHIGGALKPLYVIRKDPETNNLVVGENHALAIQSLTAIELNWIAFDRLELPMSAKARLRSQQAEIPCQVLPNGENAVGVRFKDPQVSVSPGQSVVFYEEDTVLGGGIIQSTQALN